MQCHNCGEEFKLTPEQVKLLRPEMNKLQGLLRELKLPVKASFLFLLDGTFTCCDNPNIYW